MCYAAALIGHNNLTGLCISDMSQGGLGNQNAALWLAFNGNYDVTLIRLSCFSASAWIQGTRKFNGTPNVLMPDGSFFG
jgi:hypothetical protein